MIVSDIIVEVAREFEVRPHALISKDKPGYIMGPRFALYKVLHNRGASYAQVGRWCGKRDHTTIRYGVGRADYMMENDDYYRSAIERLSSLGRQQPEQECSDD